MATKTEETDTHTHTTFEYLMITREMDFRFSIFATTTTAAATVGDGYADYDDASCCIDVNQPF